MWDADPLLARSGGGELAEAASPAFRVSACFPYRAAHPYVLTGQWEALFALFAPILRDRCDRIQMWDNPGAKARRSKAIQPGDWHPFAHLRSVHSDVDDGMFTGFYFVDASDTRNMRGRGPAAFRFFVGSAIRLDACIPLEDWHAGALDGDALVAALQALPYVSFAAGYGLCLSDRFAEGDSGEFLGQLMPLAARYPALDLVHAEKRTWFDGTEHDFARVGLTGINWLTGVGEPFVTQGGRDRLGAGLPADIAIASGPNGIVFRLGPKPLSGEAGVDDAALPLYAALGARLRTVWMPQPCPSPLFGDDHAHESLVYERRFFGQ
jgi:hypothetical protein